MTIVSCRVRYRCNDHRLLSFDYFVDHAVGKPVGIAPTDVLVGMPAALEQRVVRQRVEHLDDLLAKFLAQG